MLTKTFRAALIAGSASFALLASCSNPAETDLEGVTFEVAKTAEPVKLETPPAGQLPKGVTPLAYTLDLVTDPALDGFSGIVEITVRLDQPHARIWLHSIDHSVVLAKATLLDGTEIAATFTRSEAEGGVSRLDFETPLPAGQAVLRIEYDAPYNFGLAGLYKATQKDRPYLATQMEPIDARRMVPSFDEPRFKTPWTTRITAPAGNQVITNGALKAQTTLDDGSVRYEFATTREIQSYLLALAVGPYDMRDGGVLPANQVRATAVPFRGFAPAGKGAQLEEAMEITNAMVTWQEAYFDYPYPYGKLDIIAVPDFAYGAMENAGAIIYRESALLINDRTSLTRKRGIMTTHAHELGHQWFGNLVTPVWWDDIWLNEAFATWISYKTMDAVYPGTGFDLAPQRAAIGVMGADSLINARQIRNPITRNADILDAFDGITYRKGGGVLSMFENYLGEDEFRAGMRLHMRKFEDGVADVNDFMASLAEGSGNPDVIESFKSFIFQPGIPYLDVTLSCPALDAGLITVTQTRYAPLGSEIDPNGQTWTVPFAIRVSTNGEDRTIRQMLNDKTTEIALDGGCADWAIPNAGGAGYWRFTLDQDGWANLIDAYDSLSAGEQLVFADSLTAAFSAGRIDADTLLKGLMVNANGDWGAASDPLGNIASYFAALPDEDSKDAMRSIVMDAYGSRYEYLTTRSAAGLSQGEVLLRDRLNSTMVNYGRADDQKAALIDRAKAYIGMEGEPDAGALPPADLSLAITLATEAEGTVFFDAALAFAKASENQRERRIIYSILASKGVEADVLKLMDASLGEDFQGQETWSITLAALRNEAAQDAAWAKYKADFSRIIERTPQIRVPATAGAVGSFCEADKIDEAVAFFEANAELIPGYERRLAQSAESARLCAAFRAAKADELAEALK